MLVELGKFVCSLSFTWDYQHLTEEEYVIPVFFILILYFSYFVFGLLVIRNNAQTLQTVKYTISAYILSFICLFLFMSIVIYVLIQIFILISVLSVIFIIIDLLVNEKLPCFNLVGAIFDWIESIEKQELTLKKYNQKYIETINTSRKLWKKI